MRHGKTTSKLEGVFNKKFNENGAVYERQISGKTNRKTYKEDWSILGQKLVNFSRWAEGGQNEGGFRGV